MHREQRRQQAEGQRQHAQQGRLSSEQQRHTNEEVRQTGEDTSPQGRQRWHHGTHMDTGMCTALVWRPRRGMRTSKGAMRTITSASRSRSVSSLPSTGSWRRWPKPKRGPKCNCGNLSCPCRRAMWEREEVPRPYASERSGRATATQFLFTLVVVRPAAVPLRRAARRYRHAWD